MTAPAVFPATPATTGVRSVAAAAGVPRGESAPDPFDQHLQAARSAPSARPPVRGGASSSGAAAKPARGGVGGRSAEAPAPHGQAPADAMQGDTVPDAPVAAEAGDAAAGAVPKAAPSKTAAPDGQGAATLAVAMLAMLGQVTGGATATSPDADDATGAADGSASGLARAAVLPQRLLLGDAADSAATAAATPAVGPAGLPGEIEMECALAAPAADTRKEHDPQALALAVAPAPAPAPTALPQLQLSSPPGSPGFADELGQQVVWLGRQDIQQAKIRLHPQDLGSLDVQLSVSHDRVDVVFSAQHPAAVTAVQQSLPQLDHMLNRHGLSLGHAEVGQQGGNGHARSGGSDATAVDEVGEVHVAGTPAATGQVGLLDAFA